MKFTRGTYPDIPGHPGDPCWQLSARWLWIDADWNTRFPFGASLGLALGAPVDGKNYRRGGPGFLLDLNPPLGEPNRLHLNGRRWHVTLGLLSFRTLKPTGEEIRGVPVHRECLGRPHVDGLDRYRYHRDSDGKWQRNDKPEPLHWGWLTIERNRSDR